MRELSRWSDDKVRELIAIIHETTIDSFDDLNSFDLFFFCLLFLTLVYETAVDDLSLWTLIDTLIDHEVDRLDRWHNTHDSILDLIVELFGQVILMKR